MVSSPNVLRKEIRFYVTPTGKSNSFFIFLNVQHVRPVRSPQKPHSVFRHYFGCDGGGAPIGLL
ncbi:hypothetical protein K443DRAFT_674919 [Laccaria amethystina LaAM-08-1]|uniref:Uncharacterized protein n=1 Tax=Laccaria amethystina LaAM-08-1 TaxID=1095629 RepID=A0A0C9Y606_9AGAR|nr:hypothetical protein K443DRAFT_674919 [Laccaria amethystina LaAM-08-1]